MSLTASQKTILMRAVILNEREFLIANKEMCQPLKDLYNSVTPCFLIMQLWCKIMHVTDKRSIQTQVRPTDYTITEAQKVH